MEKGRRGKVALCTPTPRRPFPQFLDALEAEVPLLHEAGWEDGNVYEVGNSYISLARAYLLARASAWNADVVVFLDHDESWRPGDLLKLIETEGDVVAGTYRFKKPEVEYMGTIEVDKDGRPLGRASDGALLATAVPAGFLKVTKSAVERFSRAYPEMIFNHKGVDHIDLFSHGVHKRVWWGEDYAFARNWRALGEPIWLVPDLGITHWSEEITKDGRLIYNPHPGNFHQYLMGLPGGALNPELELRAS